MTPIDGLSETNHIGFNKLVREDFSSIFKCSYIINKPSVHSKVYVWSKDNRPVKAYAGSANYTLTAYNGRKQREFIVEAEPVESFEYIQNLIDDTIYCDNLEAENVVQIYNDKAYEKLKRSQLVDTGDGEASSEVIIKGLPSVTISFLGNNGDLPVRSGLNWGQRPEANREPNQGYIRVPSNIGRSDFFPDTGVHFTIQTDDNKTLICSVAQEGRKAIHTPHNNSLIGEYFRYRLGVPSGELVKKEDLIKYGRSTVTIYKLDNEAYYLDFSV